MNVRWHSLHFVYDLSPDPDLDQKEVSDEHAHEILLCHGWNLHHRDHGDQLWCGLLENECMRKKCSESSCYLTQRTHPDNHNCLEMWKFDNFNVWKFESLKVWKNTLHSRPIHTNTPHNMLEPIIFFAIKIVSIYVNLLKLCYEHRKESKHERMRCCSRNVNSCHRVKQ